MTYHYTESGLDNVYLIDGYTVHKTPYGKGVSIQNTEGLHRAIGKWLIAQPRPLNGAELRFIRTEMELTQRALAGIIMAAVPAALRNVRKPGIPKTRVRPSARLMPPTTEPPSFFARATPTSSAFTINATTP